MKTYTKKPLTVKAFQWDGKQETLEKNVTQADLSHFEVIGKNTTIYSGLSRIDPQSLIFQTNSGKMVAAVGDYVILDELGEFLGYRYHFCDQLKFNELYR